VVVLGNMDSYVLLFAFMDLIEEDLKLLLIFCYVVLFVSEKIQTVLGHLKG